MQQVFKKSPLHDAEKHLRIVGVVLLAAFGPAVRAVHGVLGGGMIAGIGGAHVKGHHDIRAQRVLDVHAHLGRDEAAAAVQMALKGHALFADLADAGEGKHLNPPLSVRMGLGQLMKRCRPPASRIRSSPGRRCR